MKVVTVFKVFIYVVFLILFQSTAYASRCAISDLSPVVISPSGNYTITRLLNNNITQYELLEKGKPVRTFGHEFGRLRFQALLDDGTFIGIEGARHCGGISLKRRIHMIDSSGKLFFSSTAKDIAGSEYLTELGNGNKLRIPSMSWLSRLNVQGNNKTDAKLVIRLANYDKIEINVADGEKKYITVTNLKGDFNGLFQRAVWYGFIDEKKKEVEYYSQALELKPHDDSVRSQLIRLYSNNTEYVKVEKIIKDLLALKPIIESELNKLDSFDREVNHIGKPLRYKFQLAENYIKQGKLIEAIGVIDEVLKLYPHEWDYNLLKAQIQITEKNRNKILQHLRSVFNFHINYIQSSDNQLSVKNFRSQEYRKSFSTWLSKNQFYLEAETVLLKASEELESEKEESYYGFNQQLNYQKLAENAKKQGDFVTEHKYLLKGVYEYSSYYYLENIAWRFVRGEGTNINHAEAINWFQKAVEVSNSRTSFFNLCYLEYLRDRQNDKKAQAWCEKGVEQGQGNAAFWLALMQLGEKAKKVSQTEIFKLNELLLFARDKNYPSYGKSERIDWDIYELSSHISKYISSLELLANKGSFIAAFHLGNLYQNGVGVDKNKQQAAFWFSKAADSGDPKSEYLYGKSLMTTDVAAAIELLESAANNGEPWAAVELGELFFKGVSVERDLERMEHWLLLADKNMKQKYTVIYAGNDKKTPAMRKLLEYRAKF